MRRDEKTLRKIDKKKKKSKLGVKRENSSEKKFIKPQKENYELAL